MQAVIGVIRGRKSKGTIHLLALFQCKHMNRPLASPCLFMVVAII
jgi:hypothetical protein